MRTVTDLHGAFALLERAADTYSDAEATAADAPATPVELVRPPIRHRRRRPVIAALAGAAATLTLAGTVSWFVASGHRGRDAGGSPDEPYLGPAPVTANVTLDPRLKMHLLAVSADATVTELDFFDQQTEAIVHLLPAGARTQLTPGLAQVDVNGHTAYYSDGTRPDFAEPNRNTATEPAPSPPNTRWARTIVWKYAPDAWIRVLVQNEIGTRAQLLRIARAVRFDKAAPIRSAFALNPHPAGLTLEHLQTTYHEGGDTPPYVLTAPNWGTLATYTVDGSSARVVVEATSVDLTANWRLDKWRGPSMTINGHPARWAPKLRELEVEAGNGAYFDVRCDQVSFSRCTAIARSVTVTPNPDQPERWYPAATALK